MTASLKIPVVAILLCGVLLVSVYQAIELTTISSNPLPTMEKQVVEFNPMWKNVVMRLLEKVRNGTRLNEEELAILAQMYRSIRDGGYYSEFEQAAEELLTLIEMIFDIHGQIVKDDGEHRGDHSKKPDGH